MQVRQIFFFTVGLIFLFLPNNAFSQTVTLNEDGEKIVVYPDGSWHFYKEESVNSTVITKHTPIDNPITTEPKGKKKKKRRKKEKEPFKVDQVYELQETRKAILRAERAAAIEETSRLAGEESVFKRIFLEEELEDAYQSIEMTHDDIAQIEVRLKNAKEEEERANTNYKEAQRRSKTYEKMIEMSSGKRNRMLAKLEEDISTPTGGGKSPMQVRAVTATITENSQQDTYVAAENRQQRPPIRSYNSKTNVLRFPPNHPCQLAYNGVDEFSGKKRKQSQKTFFFSHTPERFRSYFKGRDYLVCQGTLISVDETPRSFNIEYTIATDQAAREFGVLEKGSQLILRLIDGGKLILVNNKTATGIIDPVSKTTTYNTSYPLNKSQLKKLREAEVDKVRMIWATGYEDYEVYQVDFFRDLFRCLEEG
ncbi:MAG: hypothetical protein ACI8YQ_001331 [Polaribacter sp.]|jgi:hypothetical protein